MAAKVLEDGRIDDMVKNRYASFESEIGKKVVAGTTCLEELSEYAMSLSKIKVESGRQELLYGIMNEIMFDC